MNFTASGCVVLLRASGLPSTASSSATLPLLLLNTDLKGTLLSKAFVPVLRSTSLPLSLPFVAVNKEKINSTASPLSAGEWNAPITTENTVEVSFSQPLNNH